MNERLNRVLNASLQNQKLGLIAEDSCYQKIWIKLNKIRLNVGNLGSSGFRLQFWVLAGRRDSWGLGDAESFRGPS